METATSDALYIIRQARGMTQQEVEAAVGIPFGTLSRIERGAVEPRASLIVKLAKLYGVTANQLLGLDPVLSI